MERLPRSGRLVTILSGFFSERGLYRSFQAMNRAKDCLIHGLFLVRHDDWFAAITTRFDHAAFVIMAGFVADCVAEMHIDSPDAVAKPVQRRMHDGFDVIRELLAALNIAVCSDLDQHR
jgi:hypothetical protein